jgi:protocadherin Fat 1/2/3
LSNHATVNISVTDSNDNAPIFNQVSYSARIREDAQIGDKILQVKIHETTFFCFRPVCFYFVTYEII